MSTNSEPPPDRGGGDDDLHRLSMTILMTPDMSNFAGNVHGGLLLKYLDQVAYTCATRWSRTYAVTLSVDQVVFRTGGVYRRSKRSSSMTLTHAAAKSRTNFSFASSAE